MKHIPELDGLRGFGAIMVVAYHWNPTYIFWSWAFVPMFFVLSGFLISRILLEDLLAGRLSLKHFYMRRILRIWPVYYGALVAIFIYYLLVMGGAFFESRYFSDWLMSLVYLQFTPLYFGHLGNPWVIFEFLPGMLPVWTLAIEEQFYLILPVLLMLLLPRLGLRGLGWLCIAIAMIGPTMRLVGFAPVLLLSQLDGLFLGVLLAVIVTAQEHQPSPRRRWLMIAGFFAAIVAALLALAPYLISGYRVTPGAAELFGQPLLWSKAALFFFGLIGLIALFPQNPYSAILRTRLSLYAGSVSYALYVFHMPVLGFITPRIARLGGPEYPWLTVVLTILLLWALVHASRELVERPALRLKRLFPSARQSNGGVQ